MRGNAIIYQEYPVLLCQGFPFVEGSPGIIQKRTYEVATDRGRVKEIDIMNLEPDASFLALVNATINLQAGGVNLITDGSLSEYFFKLQLGAMKNHNLKVDLAPAQTLFYTSVANGVIRIKSQVQLFYTTPQYEDFVKNYKWKYGVGPKRQTYKLEIPNGGAPEIFNSGKITIPKQNGNIIAISCISQIENPLRLPELFYNVRFNGVTVFENVSMFNAYPETGRDKYIYPLPIQPGSTMEISVEDVLGLTAGDDAFFVTIYFDN